MRISLIFAIIISFMIFTVFPLIYVLYFEEFLIHDSRGFMILKNYLPILWACAIFDSIPNLQARIDGGTHGWTDIIK